MQVKVIMDVVISIRHRKNLAIFFVWKKEIEHHQYITCKCGQLCKKNNLSKMDSYLFSNLSASITGTNTIRGAIFFLTKNTNYLVTLEHNREGNNNTI